MSETKFTPGPWVIDPETRPSEVCTIHGMPRDERTNYQGWAYVRGELGYWDSSPDEEMANAHLIAAAPELYEALEAMLEECEDDEFAPHVMDAKAALAKARGEA